MGTLSTELGRTPNVCRLGRASTWTPTCRPASWRTCAALDWDVLFVIEDDDLRRASDVEHYPPGGAAAPHPVHARSRLPRRSAVSAGRRQRGARDSGAERAASCRLSSTDRSHLVSRANGRRRRCPSARRKKAACPYRLGTDAGTLNFAHSLLVVVVARRRRRPRVVQGRSHARTPSRSLDAAAFDALGRVAPNGAARGPRRCVEMRPTSPVCIAAASRAL